jgi:oligopeptide transport system permease protein
LGALVVALGLGVVVGALGALRPGSALDLGSLAVALLGISLPTFVTGSALLVLFGGVVQWVPIGGWDSPRHLILPAITLGLPPAAYVARLVRLGLADVMSSDYVRTARAKGLPPRRVLFDHALKVAFLPVLSFLGPATAAAMTGSFVVEKVFAVPGLGQHFVEAVTSKDQFLILGVVLVYGTMLIGFNLLVDVAYAWFDPRIDLESS